MSNGQDTNEAQPHNNRPLTAHELIQRHIEHPDVPITDEEIENIRTGSEETNNTVSKPSQNILLSPDQKDKADGLADEINKDETGMSYQADL